MTVLYSPYDIWKITSKPKWYLENNLLPNDSSLFTLLYSKYNLKPEWYLQNNHTHPNDISLFTLRYMKNNLKTRMLLTK